MNYYAKDLEPDMPVTLLAEGNWKNRTLHVYPKLGITSLEDWEVIMRDDGKAGLSFFDEEGDTVPAEVLIRWIDSTPNLTIESHE